MLVIETPPKLVYNEIGQLVEVIWSAEDYRAYLQAVAAEMDWERLPAYLQDAIDRLLVDEVRGQKADALDLEAVLNGDVDGA